MATILLVDDNIYYLKAIADLIAMLGHQAIPKSTLDEAIRAARSDLFDVLWADKNLGTYRGILPLLNVMKGDRPSIPVVICSAEDGTRARQELYCHYYFQKGTASDFIRQFTWTIEDCLRN